MNHEIESKLSHEVEQHFLKDIRNELSEMKKEIQEMKENVQPMLKWFDGMNMSRKILMWVLGLAASVGGLIIMYRQIFKD